MNWLQDLFGGGAYNLGIDYGQHDFPGPELARIAQTQDGTGTPSKSPSKPHLSLATFAGGCFWGLELAFQRVPGVVYTTAGYAQGEEPNPTYDAVCAGNTGHAEAVCVYYQDSHSQGVDSDTENGGETTTCSYETLLEVFCDRIDPTMRDGQGKDRGRHYRTGIYTHSNAQETLARNKLGSEQTKYTKPIVTELEPVRLFWPAEIYHQQYLEKGGRFGVKQSAEKGNSDEINCYG
eukprot:CAMPEP_0194397544 /NCGR_PEP_ID=MMETSP0174-20130528/125603_1 /TAXON_ID=216777 /ORGANISM="Proboscia alata, Strain PI-D3" /LENGTH=234 /DNA_ID=CAMNT_0039193733 /DNA_START=264 /DNA_END=968 /DNA_ORIENTATION=+